MAKKKVAKKASKKKVSRVVSNKKKINGWIKGAGWCYIALGAVLLLAYFLILSIGQTKLTIQDTEGNSYVALPGSTNPSKDAVPADLYNVVLILLIVFAVICIVAGVLVLHMRKFGVILGFIISFIFLFSFPIGTFLSLYTGFVLIKYYNLF